MRFHEEGLKQYYIQDDIDNSFFLSVEYEMIHQNMLEIFVPMQIREKDGIRTLLYDITEGKSLEEILKHKDAGFEECRRLVESVHQMFKIIGEYMLQIEHVSFSKKEIYVMKDGRICFMYRPDYSYELKKDAEEFFAWMLSKINYNDQLCIRFIYHVYDEVRNKGISKKVIEECMSYGSDLQERYQRAKLKKENEKRKENERQKEAYAVRQKEVSQIIHEAPGAVTIEKTDEIESQKHYFPNKRNIQVLKILCCLGVLCSIAMMFYVLSYCLRYGFQMNLLKYMAGAVCLAGVFAGLFKMFIVQMEQKDDAQHYKKKNYAR